MEQPFRSVKCENFSSSVLSVHISCSPLVVVIAMKKKKKYSTVIASKCLTHSNSVSLLQAT